MKDPFSLSLLPIWSRFLMVFYFDENSVLRCACWFKKNPFILFYNFLLSLCFVLSLQRSFLLYFWLRKEVIHYSIWLHDKVCFFLTMIFFSAHYQFFSPNSIFKEIQVYFLLHYLYVKERIFSWNIYLKNINSQACLQEDPTPFIKTQIVCVCRAAGGRDNREAEIFVCCVHSCHPKD